MSGEKLLERAYLAKKYAKLLEGPGSILHTERQMDAWHQESPHTEESPQAKRKRKAEKRKTDAEIKKEVDAEVKADEVENLGMTVDEWDKLHPADRKVDPILWEVQQERKAKTKPRRVQPKKTLESMKATLEVITLEPIGKVNMQHEAIREKPHGKKPKRVKSHVKRRKRGDRKKDQPSTPREPASPAKAGNSYGDQHEEGGEVDAERGVHPQEEVDTRLEGLSRFERSIEAEDFTVKK